MEQKQRTWPAWVALIIGLAAAIALGGPGELTGKWEIAAGCVVLLCVIVFFWYAGGREALREFLGEPERVEYDERYVTPTEPGEHHSGTWLHGRR